MTCTIAIRQPDELEEFRSAARRLLAAGITPGDVGWSEEPAGTLFADPLPDAGKAIVVPRAFADLAAAVACHRDQRRWSWLYEALWRIDHGERALMQLASDPLVYRLRRMAAAIRHDQHRMTAFLRFRAVPDADDELFIAWYEPRHRVLRRASDFFINRFANMRFSILTPDLTLHWDRQAAQFAPGLRRDDAASEDGVEDWWRRYYAAIFNPARINPRLMQSHMPKHFWRDLPEARIISELMQEAGARTAAMIRSCGADGSAPQRP